MIWVGMWLGHGRALARRGAWASASSIVFPLTFICSAFVPIESMPDPLQWVAS